ncbi:MAG: copper resistance system multicopper oxidase, partial [Alphaproteobacteria bacterium]|nr:copper resistance system multicopper oxidase [Alphaproteobacteria bacterium]
DRTPVLIDGKKDEAITLNGTLPAPLLRWREGDDLTLRVHNRLGEDTSIHWHGILLPPHMDGVPGVSFPGIKPGETFIYRFPVKQAGTYWYHSHSNLQEQLGHYGPLLIEPAGEDPVAYDREHIIVLSDWAFMDPHALFMKLKKMGHAFNYDKRTLGDFFQDVGEMGFSDAVEERSMWGDMRMDPTDLSDVNGATYTFLINGHGPADNWTGLFHPGERVRLRIINASAMSIFNLRIPGLPMTVVQADGLNVKPVEVDEFQIGVAETYDVVIAPENRAYTLMAEGIARQGYVRATLSPRPGLSAEVPPLREPPLLTMKDMGMAHGGSHGTSAKDSGQGMDHSQMDHAQMDHSMMGHDMHGGMDMKPAMGMESGMDMSGEGDMVRHDHPTGPGVMNTAMMPVSRLHEPGLGLENVPHRTLSYADLESLEPNPDRRAPGREIELHLTSNMERYMWSFDGVKFSEVDGPVIFHEGERLRLTMVNDTMMNHPIHLHGMFFDVVNGSHHHKPRKHTIIVKPGEKLSVDITADAVGDWAFHCHLLYHMHAGMFRVVSVKPKGWSA